MRKSSYKTRLILGVLLVLSACAQLGALDMRRAEVGMTREQAIASIQGQQTPYFLRSGPTEYVLFRMTSSFTSMYSDYPHSVFFIRLEHGKVVERGLVGNAEQERIRRIAPTFSLREWQGKGGVVSDPAEPR